MNRAELLRSAAFAVLAPAATVPDGDLAYLRLLVAVELLKADFESRAKTPSVIRRMQADDAAHYNGLAGLMANAGQTPATAADIDFSYPKGSFASTESVLALASKLTALTLGAYLGALENVQTPALRLPLGQIAANEAQQASALAQALGRPPIGNAFATALPIDAVSAALGKYES